MTRLNMKKKKKTKEYPVLSTVAKDLEIGFIEDKEKRTYTFVVGKGQWIKETGMEYELRVRLSPQPIGYMITFSAYENGELFQDLEYTEFSILACQINIQLGNLLYDKDQCYSFFTVLKLIQPDVDGWRIRTFKEQNNREMERLLATLK